MTTNEHNAFPNGRWSNHKVTTAGTLASRERAFVSHPTFEPAVKLVTLAGKTYEPLNNVAGKEYACPFCQSLLHRRLGDAIGQVTIECLNPHCDASAQGKDIESAYEILRYTFETRDLPAITGQDTVNEYDI